MNTHKINKQAASEKKDSCCHRSAIKNNKRVSLLSRFRLSWRGFIPSILLILMPKCAVCFAGYVTLITGVGLSITTAAYVRIALIILCVISLLYLATKRLLNLRRML